jgi:hypothetical protein
MQLWQLDVTASAFLADGREVKIVIGLDDHSRYCVITRAVLRATARPVCRAPAFHSPDRVGPGTGLPQRPSGGLALLRGMIVTVIAHRGSVAGAGRVSSNDCMGTYRVPV